ncbi:B3 domain-containing protein At3g25182-like [Solanum verrucosum]|uniref:B3 domain-containing protein At3g25182-like n=1 Tax=Solanum verrucosum TaxID=315347 RepID=UPI0020D171C5|nr:B3 domain-containing protein At3g25182-like [Solanum verrucosum]
MVYTLLSLDDFSGMKITPNMSSMDYLLAVSEVSYLKSMYGEEDNLIAEQDEEFRIKKEERITQNIRSIVSSFPEVVDFEKPVLDFTIPRGKRSRPNARPREVKVLENNSEEEHRVVQVDNEERNRKRSREEANGNFRPVVVAPPAVIVNRELSIEFKNLITFHGGLLESAKLVIEKTLFETDVKAAEGRFSIPQKQMSNQFLKPEEEQLLNGRNEANKMCEMNVMLIEPSHKKGEINLRKWTMNKNNGKASSSYVLVKHWNDVVRRNGLRAGMKMQLWAFRKGENLCFALVNV